MESAGEPGKVSSMGAPTFSLQHTGSNGGYRFSLDANPGESGTIELRVLDATWGKRLSERNIADNSRKPIDGSKDASRRFRSQGSFTISEGGPFWYFPARVEVWFLPRAGGPERKLLERLYRVEGF